MSDKWISHRRFKKLDTDKSGTVSLKELMELPELKKNPLTKRIMGIKYYNNKLRSVLVTPVSRIKKKYGAVVISMFSRFMSTDITMRK